MDTCIHMDPLNDDSKTLGYLHCNRSSLCKCICTWPLCWLQSRKMHKTFICTDTSHRIFRCNGLTARQKISCYSLAVVIELKWFCLPCADLMLCTWMHFAWMRSESQMMQAIGQSIVLALHKHHSSACDSLHLICLLAIWIARHTK